MTRSGKAHGRVVGQVSPAEFVAATGLVASVTPIVRADRTVGGRVTVHGTRDGQIVPARVDHTGVLRGLPSPVAPGDLGTIEWTISSSVLPIGDAGQVDDGLPEPAPAIHVSPVLTERSPTIDVQLVPRTTFLTSDDGPLRWRAHRLVVTAEATPVHSATRRVQTTLPPTTIHQVVIGVPAMVVVSPTGAAANGRSSSVIVDDAGPVRTLDEARDVVRVVRRSYDLAPDAVPLTVLHALDDVIAQLRRAETGLAFTHHGTAVLPAAVDSAVALGGPGTCVRLLLPGARAERALGVAITIGGHGVTSVDTLGRGRPDSTPVQHVTTCDIDEAWLAGCAPLLHFVG